MDREKVIKALECRKNADKRCGNPCENAGFCHYATAVRGLDGEIYRPFVCDRERICADAIFMLKEQENTIIELQNAYGYLQKQFFEAQDKLLKEQEAVEPFHKCIGKDFSLIEDSHFDYCPYCGKPITWAKQEGR